MRASIPKGFEGTDAERTFNRESHDFVRLDHDERCARCDTRPFSVHADYACGAEVPREFHDLPAWVGTTELPEVCTGLTYQVNPDDPSEGSDIHHNGPCPVHDVPDITDKVRAEILENLRR